MNVNFLPLLRRAHGGASRERQRATLHHDPQYCPIRNHRVDFLVAQPGPVARPRGGGAPGSEPGDRPRARSTRPAEENRMSRLDVAEKIVATQVTQGLKWSDVAGGPAAPAA